METKLPKAVVVLIDGMWHVCQPMPNTPTYSIEYVSVARCTGRGIAYDLANMLNNQGSKTPQREEEILSQPYVSESKFFRIDPDG